MYEQLSKNISVTAQQFGTIQPYILAAGREVSSEEVGTWVGSEEGGEIRIV